MSGRKRKRAPLRGGNKKPSLRVRASSGVDLDDVLDLKDRGELQAFEEMLLYLYKTSKDIDTKAQVAYELAVYYCQRLEFVKADSYLQLLGYSYRLTRSVWDYTQLEKRSSTGGFASSFDDVLPQSLLTALCEAFSRDSPFWSEHGYPTDSFFSYNIPLDVEKKQKKKMPHTSKNIIEQLALHLRPLVASAFPDKDINTHVGSVEWWAHSRSTGPAAGHRLHYDLDELALCGDDGAKAVADRTIHPLVSCVLYLDDGGSSGAPTLVTTQTLSSDSPVEEAWMCSPKTNRLLMFDGALLHGVVPHISITSGSAPRLTLMLGWWGKQVHTSPSPQDQQSLRPNMRMPDSNGINKSSLMWPRFLRPVKFTPIDDTHGLPKVPSEALFHVEGGVWEQIGRDTSVLIRKSRDLSRSAVRFVGNWFLYSLSEINDEIHAAARIGKGDDDCNDRNTAAVDWISAEELSRMRGESKN